MKIKIWQRILIIVILLFAGSWIWRTVKGNRAKKPVIEEVKPERGDIEIFIETTGTVQPQNRLEMKPPINGRVEEILVHEGDLVKKGQIVAWMSSIERAALLDAARSKDAETLTYWEDAYKATPLIAPIDGSVIVRAVEPGQTVTSADPIIVLSDRLIVKAQVDETDIGRVKVGQKSTVSLDAYPREKITASVDHILYESKTVNNVTIYEVDILPKNVPEIFRSGMTANVGIVEDSRQDVLRLPVGAVRRQKDGTFILVKEKEKSRAKLRPVKTGFSNGDHVEIIEGLSEQETVIVEKPAASLPKRSSASNPFMPSGGSGGQRNR